MSLITVRLGVCNEGDFTGRLLLQKGMVNREAENMKKNLFTFINERTLRLRLNDSIWRVEDSREKI